MAGQGKGLFSRVHNRDVTASARSRKTPQIQSEVAPLVGEGSTHSWNDNDFAEADRVGDEGFERAREEEVGEEVEVERLGSPNSCGSRLKVRRVEKGRWGRASEGSSSSVVAPKKKKSSKDTSWMISDRVPGGPLVTNVIPSFGGHIAHKVWSTPNEGGRPVLTGYHRFGKMKWLNQWPLPLSVKGVCGTSGLSHLRGCMAEHLNMPLISSFVERWQPDTNSFHMPFGEITILLHDVAQILGIRVDGDICKVENDDGNLVDPLMYVCGYFGRSSSEELRLPLSPNKKAHIYRSGGILVEAVSEVAIAGGDDEHAQGFMAILLGSTLFVDKTGDRIRPQLFPLLADTDSISSYAWGAGTLAYMYRQLGLSSRTDVKTIAGCLSLLQAWIYEYFPLFRPGPPSDIAASQPRVQCWSHVGPFPQTEKKLLEYRRILDGLTTASVRWEPFGSGQEKSYPRTLFSGCVRFMDIVEPYQPDRCLRQFGYKQMIPGPIVPVKAHRPSSGIGYDVEVGPLADHLWESWEDHRVHLSERSTQVSFPGESAREYESWFPGVSHPLIIDPDHRDAPLPRDDADVTVETAHAILDQFAAARKIVDDGEQLKFFRRMLKDVGPMIDARQSRRKPCKGPTPGNRVQRLADGYDSLSDSQEGES